MLHHFHVDGTITTAKLKRPLLAGAVYKDVTVRQEDGSERRVGTLMVHNDMVHAMTPGGRGRFYFYNVLGTKGIHGYRAADGGAHGSFPGRWVGMCFGIALLNLLLVAGWLLQGVFAPFTAGMAVTLLLLAAAFAFVGSGAMRAYRADAPAAPTGERLVTAAA